MKKAEFIVSLTLIIVNAIIIIGLIIGMHYSDSIALHIIAGVLAFIEVGLILTIFNFYQNYKDSK
ncbi:MAG: hypothetical protein K6G48_04770 [Acholeplasmatales bacterium]|nr:hypothetical protein [Acholeplasmatales bacterium]